MRKQFHSAALALALLVSCAACTTTSLAVGAETLITLSDSTVTVDGQAASTSPSDPVYTGAGIVYYEDGKDAAYGEGTESDAHTADEAAAQLVVTITQPGVYRVTGTLSAGQLAVDLGEGAESDPDAVVTLILDNANITCTVAPAVIFYRVYECGSYDTASATNLVDTARAGANVILADGSVNNIDGSYVAKIYKEGTTKKLHKYDGAFYSKMSMNVIGGALGTGVLNLTAGNEGLDAELHLTLNGGVINITAQNDGINTSEDGVSVATVNGGSITIDAGLGAEGDGIDSNGFLVVNGGAVVTQANPKAGDGGLDADGGIFLNGGTVVALGSRNDTIEAASTQTYMELNFAATVPAGSTIELRDADGATVLTHTTTKDFQAAVLSSPALALDTAYSVYVDGIQQQYTGAGGGMMGGGFGGTKPDGEPPALPDGTEWDGDRPQRPEDGTAPTPPEDGTAPTRPEGASGQGSRGGNAGSMAEPSSVFTLTDTSKAFSGVSAVEAAT